MTARKSDLPARRRPGATARLGWERPQTLADRIYGAAVAALLRGLAMVPWNARRRMAGWFGARLMAPLTGREALAIENVQRVWPELDHSQARRIARAAHDNLARSFVEWFDAERFMATAAAARVDGPGLAEIERARAEGCPFLLASGHYGNFQAVMAWLASRGWKVAGVYRPLNNRILDALYVSALSAFVDPLIPRGPQGTRRLVAHLRAGGGVALLFDQLMREGEELELLGQKSLTITGPAELALKTGAVLVPVRARRAPDGLNFEITFEEPIPPSDPRRMSQALNDRLTAWVTEEPGQWLWSHRRWKRVRPVGRAARSKG